ncbi:MAG: bifunctional pyr operon transcriptional regulator/uracil phosphoribosyltransferase PyrR [Firmicutes bacterium]|nr:bifunctional pyr operon transcriptional regulator/uracil phosphoribosyltransferase PyrR [Bacillota bacterium]MDY4972685.1 bifunctional pyr operon transcriptional regulator/uracil phosphoribosyltransferase PyrR [Erysipelotrichaceae bacterium]
MKELLDDVSITRSLKRMAHEIVEKNKGCDNLVLVGIKTRGEFLAKRICDYIYDFENERVECDSLDITYWRDDMDDKPNIIPLFKTDVKNKVVVLVDDVLFSGRSVRAAMEGIMYYGRAAEIHLAVLIDRGHRELPIRADYVGKNIPTSLSENIAVKLHEIDDCDGVFIE